MASRDTIGRSNKQSADDKLAESMGHFYADPLGYVMFAFPWDTYTPIQLVELEPKYRDRFNSKYGPDKWACEFLDDLGKDIAANNFDGQMRYNRYSMRQLAATVSVNQFS